jgi:glycosyltransferase involved in cell wall biosynthesis
MTRIAYICGDPGIPVFGAKGSSVHVQEVVRQLVRGGAEVTLFCARTGGEPPAGLGAVRVVPLRVGPTRSLADRELALMAADEDLATRLLASGPFDAVYERYSLWGQAGMRYAAITGVPGILEVNSPLVEEQAEHRGLHHVDEARARAAAALGAAVAAVCVSAPVAAWVERTAPGANISVVPNGVDPTRFPLLPEPGGPFTAVFLGTLKPWHGVDVLVRAAALLDGLRLRIVGDGPQRADLEALVAELGLGARVVFTGAVPPGAVPAELAKGHVGCAPYPVADGYFSPMKVFEYLAAGLPVVASQSGQLPCVVDDGSTGLLVEPGSAESLADGLDRLRADPVLRVRMRGAARRSARAHTWARTVDATLAAAGLSLPGRRPARSEAS